MDLKKDDNKRDAFISENNPRTNVLDFREAYVRKQMHPKFRDLTDRIAKLKHSERAMKRLMEDLNDKRAD